MTPRKQRGVTGDRARTQGYRNKKPRPTDRAFPARRRLGLNDAHVATAESALHFELDHAFDFSEEGVVFAHAHAETGMELGAALTNDDVAGLDDLTTIHFHAKAFTFGIAAVTGRTASFLCAMSQYSYKGSGPTNQAWIPVILISVNH